MSVGDSVAATPFLRAHRFVNQDRERPKVTFYVHPDPEHEDDKFKVHVPTYSGNINEDFEAFATTLKDFLDVVERSCYFQES